jgi:hypothetical protein
MENVNPLVVLLLGGLGAVKGLDLFTLVDVDE